MPKVTFVNEKREIEIPEGAVLRDEALKAGIQVNFLPLDTGTGAVGRYLNCHGLGLCGTCLILVKKGMENLSPKTRREKFACAVDPKTMMAVIGHEEEARLACQVKVSGDCTVETRPPFNWSGEADKKGKHFWETPYPNK
jgi:ferredoxin